MPSLQKINLRSFEKILTCFHKWKKFKTKDSRVQLYKLKRNRIFQSNFWVFKHHQACRNVIFGGGNKVHFGKSQDKEHFDATDLHFIASRLDAVNDFRTFGIGRWYICFARNVETVFEFVAWVRQRLVPQRKSWFLIKLYQTHIFFIVKINTYQTERILW